MNKTKLIVFVVLDKTGMSKGLWHNVKEALQAAKDFDGILYEATLEEINFRSRKRKV